MVKSQSKIQSLLAWKDLSLESKGSVKLTQILFQFTSEPWTCSRAHCSLSWTIICISLAIYFIRVQMTLFLRIKRVTNHYLHTELQSLHNLLSYGFLFVHYQSFVREQRKKNVTDPLQKNGMKAFAKVDKNMHTSSSPNRVISKV